MKSSEQILVGKEMKVESLPPMDPDIVKIINRILDQNEQILSQNAKLVDMLSKPVFVVNNHTS